MRAFLALLAACALLPPLPREGAGQEAVVNAVLFYSPTCPHCHSVINNDLPPLRRKHGDRLVIVGVDVTTQRGAALYEAVVNHYAIPESRLGVPCLVVGNTVLVGSLEIPQQFPGIIERGLESGGIDWPPVEELRQVLAAEGVLASRPGPRPTDEARAPTPSDSPAAAPPRPEAGAPAGPAPGVTPQAGPDLAAGGEAPRAPEGAAEAGAGGEEGRLPSGAPGVGTLLSGDTAASFERPGPGALFLQDPLGNGIAVATLLGLLAVLAWSVRAMLRTAPRRPRLPEALFAILGLAGAGIAAYLSFVEVTGAAAVCGPVGDCNTVQQSAWARLFGVLPVGVLGLAGYLGLLAAWGTARWGPPRVGRAAWTAAWAMALVGTAFSAWLTFLEPFVIGATCAWCVSSAVVMALMLVGATERASTPPAGPDAAP